MTRRTETLAALTLLGLAAAWGSTFFLIHDLSARLPAPDFLTVRFGIGAAVLFALAPRAVLRLPRRVLLTSILCGLVYGVAQLLQTEGIARTPASIAGFLTSLYVILTPFLAALMLRHRLRPVVWVAVGLALIGLATLSLQGVSVGIGQVIILIAAALYALHVTLLGLWSTPEAALGSSIVQLVVVALVSLVFAVPGGVAVPHGGTDWTSLLYMAVVVAALGLLGQVWAQSHLPPTRSALIMAMEPVFAATCAVLFGQDSLTVRLLIGGLLVIAAILLVELTPRRSDSGTPEIEQLPV